MDAALAAVIPRSLPDARIRKASFRSSMTRSPWLWSFAKPAMEMADALSALNADVQASSPPRRCPGCSSRLPPTHSRAPAWPNSSSSPKIWFSSPKSTAPRRVMPMRKSSVGRRRRSSMPMTWSISTHISVRPAHRRHGDAAARWRWSAGAFRRERGRHRARGARRVDVQRRRARLLPPPRRFIPRSEEGCGAPNSLHSTAPRRPSRRTPSRPARFFAKLRPVPGRSGAGQLRAAARIRGRSANRGFAMKFLSFIGAIAIVVAIAAAIFLFGGFYNVAATEPRSRHRRLDARACPRSPRSRGTPPKLRHPVSTVPITSSSRCARLRGARLRQLSRRARRRPGPSSLRACIPTRRISRTLPRRPSPARSIGSCATASTSTGMPSFAANVADDMELWQIAAFVKKLPDIADADYKAWVEAGPPPADPPAPK